MTPASPATPATTPLTWDNIGNGRSYRPPHNPRRTAEPPQDPSRIAGVVRGLCGGLKPRELRRTSRPEATLRGLRGMRVSDLHSRARDLLQLDREPLQSRSVMASTTSCVAG